MTASGQNGAHPARLFCAAVLSGAADGKEEAGRSKKSVQGLTAKALMFAMAVFWMSPSLDVALRCIPEECMRDSTSARGASGARRSYSSGGKTGEIIDGFRQVACELKHEASEAEENYFAAHAAAAKAETAKSAVEMTNTQLATVDAQIEKLKDSEDAEDVEFVQRLKEKRRKLRNDVLAF